MKTCHIYCDKCKSEMEYYPIPRYVVDKYLREIVSRSVMNIEHLCEPCMHSLNSEISKAVDLWKQSK